MNEPEKYELPPGVAPERTGNSTFDNWWPGKPDENQQKVKDESDPERPGVRLSPELVEVDGLIVSRQFAIMLGLI